MNNSTKQSTQSRKPLFLGILIAVFFHVGMVGFFTVNTSDPTPSKEVNTKVTMVNMKNPGKLTASLKAALRYSDPTVIVKSHSSYKLPRESSTKPLSVVTYSKVMPTFEAPMPVVTIKPMTSVSLTDSRSIVSTPASSVTVTPAKPFVVSAFNSSGVRMDKLLEQIKVPVVENPVALTELILTVEQGDAALMPRVVIERSSGSSTLDAQLLSSVSLYYFQNALDKGTRERVVIAIPVAGGTK